MCTPDKICDDLGKTNSTTGTPTASILPTGPIICPTCHTCPTCGRGPVYQFYPYRQIPYTVFYTDGGLMDTSANAASGVIYTFVPHNPNI